MHFDQEPQPRKKKFLGIFGSGGRQESPEIVQQFEQFLTEQQSQGQGAIQDLSRYTQLIEQQQQYFRRQQEVRRRSQLIEEWDEIGSMVCQRLKQQTKDTHLDTLARSIQKHFNNNAYHVRVRLIEETEPQVRLWGGEFIVNNTRYDLALLYSHKDVHYYFADYTPWSPDVDTDYEGEWYGSVKKVTKKLSFGIGYFSSKETIIPEARGSVSDSELAKGIKAYYIHSTSQKELDAKTGEGENVVTSEIEEYVFPVACPSYRESFLRHLSRIVEALSPNNVIPLARKRIQAHQMNEMRRNSF